MMTENIIYALLSLGGIAIGLVLIKLLQVSKHTPKRQTFSKGAANILESGPYVTHGMVMSEDGKSVQADSKISEKYIDSVI